MVLSIFYGTPSRLFWTENLKSYEPDCSQSPLVSSNAGQNSQMMCIKGQIPAFCGKFCLFPLKTLIFFNDINPFTCFLWRHIQAGIFVDNYPWLWAVQIKWIHLVYDNLEINDFYENTVLYTCRFLIVMPLFPTIWVRAEKIRNFQCLEPIMSPNVDKSFLKTIF